MTSTEQEALFAKVRKRFPDNHVRWASGYVHGVVDEAEKVGPPREYREREDYYAEGYCCGFMDARGSDCWSQRWAKAILYRYRSEFRWWWKGR